MKTARDFACKYTFSQGTALTHWTSVKGEGKTKIGIKWWLSENFSPSLSVSCVDTTYG